MPTDHGLLEGMSTPPAHGEGAPAPGKHARTQDLPPGQFPTGHPLLDQGLYCTHQPAHAPGCYLEPRRELLLIQMIATAAQAACSNLFAALGKIRVDLLTQKAHSWSGGHEVAFLLITGALSGPLSAALATAVVRAAPRLAEAGAVNAAWAMASYDPQKASRALGVAFRGLRSELAHGGGALPTNQVEFVDYLSTLVQPTAGRILQSIAAEQLNHDEMLALYDSLNDPALVSIPAIERRIRELLETFDDNRVGYVGNQMFGTREVACPVVVTYRRAEYLALCESFGLRHSALALNGSPDPNLTMDSLVFVRVVERPFHQLLQDEFRARRRAEPPRANFNRPADRARHRWATDFQIELSHHAHPDQLALAVADDDQDPYQP